MRGMECTLQPLLVGHASDGAGQSGPFDTSWPSGLALKSGVRWSHRRPAIGFEMIGGGDGAAGVAADGGGGEAAALLPPPRATLRLAPSWTLTCWLHLPLVGRPKADGVWTLAMGLPRAASAGEERAVPVCHVQLVELVAVIHHV